MSKEYKLDTERIVEVEGCAVLGYYTKGHHDKAEFAKCVVADWEEDKAKAEEIEERTEHVWAKLVPWGGGGMMFTYSNEYRKSYWPITKFEY